MTTSTGAGIADTEKAPSERRRSMHGADADVDADAKHQPTITSPTNQLTSALHAVERALLRYNVESRGIQRVEEDEKHQVSWLAYLQVCALWTSINLVVNNITLGMLGPAIYQLSFADAAICAALGAFLGSLPVAWISTWGHLSGVRTMAWSRYSMGWYPSKLVVVLNIIVMLGYALLVCIIGGQILSAVSPNGSMSVVVGIIVVAVITWGVTTFGISVFHYYERFAWFPQLIVVSILYGVSAKFYDTSTPSAGDARTVAGNRLSFFSLAVAAAITYSGAAMDYFVYWPTTMSRPIMFAATQTALSLSFTFALIVGVGLGSGINTVPSYSSAWTDEQGGSGSGALLVAGFATIGTFGKFCAVMVALGGIANTIPPTYSSGVDFQILNRLFMRVPRVIWNTVGVIIYTVCALAGRNNLAVIFTNFLALMGYWVAIWIAIAMEEHLIFRKADPKNYNWHDWNNRQKLPHGIAACAAFLIGWAGSILCMAQVWYIGPIARLVGDFGADMGNYVGFCWAALVFPPLRWLELKKFGR